MLSLVRYTLVLNAQTVQSVWGASGAKSPAILRARHTKAVHGKMSFKITCKYDSQYILK